MNFIREESVLLEDSSTHGFFDEFSNLKYPRSCREALERVFPSCRDGKYMDPEILESALSYCERRAQATVNRGEGCGLNEAEITALFLYSADFMDVRGSFHTAVNAVFRSQDRYLIKPFKHIIWLLLWAMKESPACYDVVFRGVKLDISGDYIVGETVVWRPFSSCVRNEEVLKQEYYLGNNGTRVIFEVTPTCRRARSISAISVYPAEEEVLFPPNTSYFVEAKVDAGNGLTRIFLKETPSFDPILDFEDSAVTVPSNYFLSLCYLLICDRKKSEDFKISLPPS